MQNASGNEVWDAFARSVVTVELPTGSSVLRPDEAGQAGVFPFERPVHIITAYNPGGELRQGSSTEVESENQSQHLRLAERLTRHECIASVASAIDGSFAEPGFAVLDIDLDDAVAIANDFGQRAIYRWSADQLAIVGVSEPVRIELGWALRHRGIVLPPLDV